MRRWLLGGVGIAAMAAAAAALLAIHRAEPPLPSAPPVPPVAEAPPPSPPPAPPVAETPLPPEPEPPAPLQTADFPPPPPSPAPALPPLPEREVKALPAHPVPDYRSAPIPHVTMEDRNGNPIARPSAPSAPSAAAAPAPPPLAEPPQRGQKGRAPPAQQAASPMPASLSGPAQATGTLTLALQGHSVRLFGVSAPEGGDRCLLEKGDPRPCSEVTQQVLAARLARSASVTCTAPSGAAAALPTRICLDDKGVDIAGFLVGEGLALDDPRQTSDYRGAEGVARSLKKGLWAYR
ncbi:MAG: thermonuclease family protein [Acidobacteriota bacterium]